MMEQTDQQQGDKTKHELLHEWLEEEFKCCVCFEMEIPVELPCGHFMCGFCVKKMVDMAKVQGCCCPVCRHKLTPLALSALQVCRPLQKVLHHEGLTKLPPRTGPRPVSASKPWHAGTVTEQSVRVAVTGAITSHLLHYYPAFAMYHPTNLWTHSIFIEECLYASANTLREYGDMTTLAERVGRIWRLKMQHQQMAPQTVVAQSQVQVSGSSSA